ncbi:MAG TPA: hypothetical protein DEA90_07190 [Opitutae bacterium]|nr:hypothetical protein [Puniceicoccaceae bacterium]HBR93934.1 hypothetical protein [Opitutae bacterium]|tara:strand:+ start:10716 stop:11456 length:741 start_codon:yes stop_codon:yes gene_type:complete
MKPLILLSSLLVSAQLATAASVNLDSSSTVTVATDLTATGNVDWAYWNTSANPASGVATNDMNGGAGIGSIVAYGTGTTVRGTSFGTTADFSFTNGSATASGSVTNPTGLFNSVLNTAGEGVQLDFTLAQAGQAYTIDLWTAGFGTPSATIVASIPGATYNSGLISNPDGGAYGGAGAKNSYRYTFTVVADSDNDVFNFSIATGGTQQGSGHVIISAATIAVPEPATYATIAGLSALVAVMVRRRK